MSPLGGCRSTPLVSARNDMLPVTRSTRTSEQGAKSFVITVISVYILEVLPVSAIQIRTEEQRLTDSDCVHIVHIIIEKNVEQVAILVYVRITYELLYLLDYLSTLTSGHLYIVSYVEAAERAYISFIVLELVGVVLVREIAVVSTDTFEGLRDRLEKAVREGLNSAESGRTRVAQDDVIVLFLGGHLLTVVVGVLVVQRTDSAHKTRLLETVEPIERSAFRI